MFLVKDYGEKEGVLLKPIERYRKITGEYASDPTYGSNGLFSVPSFDGKTIFTVIISDGLGWEHVSVSVSTSDRIPSWEEMEYLKRMFWGLNDTVIQFHPPVSKYINKCKSCLHMWRKPGNEVHLPPSWMVG